MPCFLPQNPQQALILLHGYGSTGDDMISLGKEISSPSTLLVCPNAPINLPWGGYAWFPLDDFDLNHLTLDYATRLTDLALPLVSFVQSQITELQTHFHITPQHIQLGGFSQGGLLSLLSALLTPGIPTVIGLSSVPVSLQNLHIQNRPRILLTHGDQDFVVPPPAFRFGVNQLQSAGLSVTTFTSPDCEHAVDRKMISYLKSVLSG